MRAPCPSPSASLARLPSFGAALVVAALSAGTPRAYAQSFYVHTATLAADGENVADVAGPVTVAFRDATRVDVRFASPQVTLAGELDLADPEDFLAAGVGRDVRLDGTGAWTILLRAGTWAPVAGDGPSGVVVALPSAMPVRRATIPRGTPGARGRPAGIETWDGPGRDTTPAERDPLARYVSLRASHVGASAMWASPPGATVRVVDRVGHDRVVEIAFHGVVVRGFVDARGPLYLTPHDVSASLRPGPLLHVAAFLRLTGRAVSLPAGTALYATRDATHEVATLRAPAVGLEPLFTTPETRCTRGPPVACVRVPPEPRGPARWVVQLPGAQITAWVRTPAEALASAHVGVVAYHALRERRHGPIGWPRP